MSESPDHNLNSQPASKSNQPDALLNCPVFDAATFERQLTLDMLGRAGIVAAVIIGLAVSWMPQLVGQTGSMFVFVAIAVAWIGLNSVSSRVAMRLGRVMTLMNRDPQSAENELALVLKRWPVYRAVRLLMYHRFAVLRHRQGRFAESAAICRQMLGQKLGPADSLAARGGLGIAGSSVFGSASGSLDPQSGGHSSLRVHLLLMLAEASLHENDQWSAWMALCELGAMQVNLIESLQRLALQTQYEVATQQHQLALQHIQHKIQMAELMPAPQCGAMHALLQTSASNLGQTQLADWLGERSQLLATDEQLETLGVPHLATLGTTAS